MQAGNNLTVEELEAKLKALLVARDEAQLKAFPNGKIDEKARDVWRELYAEHAKVEKELFLAKFQQKHNSDLERKFVETFDAATVKINEKLAEASAALEQACKLSEEYGIPFSSPIVENGDCYFPRSLRERWGSVGEKTLKEFFQFHELWREYGGYDTGYGWVTSYC